MNAAAPSGEAPFEAALARFFAARDVVRIETPILQPAEPYLDTAGEAFRRRIFLTRGESGQSLCLRPDFTIPVALAHIATGAGLPQRYAYDGLVFRQGREGEAEFRQAGIENLGQADRPLADARALADALSALDACGVGSSGRSAILGDQGLFDAYLRALDLPGGWHRRLIRTFGDDALLDQALAALGRTPASETLDRLPPGYLDLARRGDEASLAAEIGAMMEESGLPPHRSRSSREVAARLVEKVQTAEARLDAAALVKLRAFLSIDCPLSQASARLHAAALAGGVDLGPALAFFEERLAALVAAGINLTEIRYRAAFGRSLDYYTGMVFEVSAAGAAGPLAGGGRYDRLVSYLGARAPIPAVGFSLWLDRIAQLTEPA